MARKRKTRKRRNPLLNRKRRTTHRRKRNPSTVKLFANKRTHRTRRHVRHRNPLTFGGGTPTTMLTGAAGAAAGGIGVLYLAQFMQLTGYVKYLAMAAAAYFGAVLLDKVSKPLAEPFFYGAMAATAITYVKDNALLAGLGGDNITYRDIANVNAAGRAFAHAAPMRGAILPGNNTMGKIFASNPTMYGSAGFDDAGSSEL